MRSILTTLPAQPAKQVAAPPPQRLAQSGRRDILRLKPVPAAADPAPPAIAALQGRFPQAFPPNPLPKVPLKIGIFDDLLAHAEELALGERELRAALKAWCASSQYRKCLLPGAPRRDLAGAPAGLVQPWENKPRPKPKEEDGGK